MGTTGFGKEAPIRLGPNRSDRMLAAYRVNLARGCHRVREMILDDIRRFSELGASDYVDDLRETLSRFEEEASLPVSATQAPGRRLFLFGPV